MQIDVGHPGPRQWVEAIESGGALWVRADEYRRLVAKLASAANERDALRLAVQSSASKWISWSSFAMHSPV